MGVSVVMAEVSNLKKRAPHVKGLKAIVLCHLEETVVTAAVLQDFRAASALESTKVKASAGSVVKVTTVTGGVLQSIVQTTHTTAI